MCRGPKRFTHCHKTCLSYDRPVSHVVSRAPSRRFGPPPHRSSYPFNPHRARIRRNHGRLRSNGCTESAPELPTPVRPSMRARSRYSASVSSPRLPVVRRSGLYGSPTTLFPSNQSCFCMIPRFSRWCSRLGLCSGSEMTPRWILLGPIGDFAASYERHAVADFVQFGNT
jgi:hypothetical protein